MLWCIGCSCLRQTAFDFDAPNSVVARAWQHIEQGYAHEEGTYRRKDLRLAGIDYSVKGVTVEVDFYVLSTFKTASDGLFRCKLLRIEMDKGGKFLSASSPDLSQGGSPLSTGS